MVPSLNIRPKMMPPKNIYRVWFPQYLVLRLRNFYPQDPVDHSFLDLYKVKTFKVRLFFKNQPQFFDGLPHSFLHLVVINLQPNKRSSGSAPGWEAVTFHRRTL